MKSLLAAAVLFFGWIAGAHATCPNYNQAQPNTTATSLSVMTADRVNITGGCINNVDVSAIGAGANGGTVTNGNNLTNNAIVLGDGGTVGVKTTTTGTGVVTALGVNTGSAGAVLVNGGALGTPSSGTLSSATGLPVSTGISGLGTSVATALAVNVGSAGAFVKNNGDALSGTFSGNPTFSGVPLFTGLSAGTQTKCLGLDSGNNLVYNASACGSGGGGTTEVGFGVDGGASSQSVTGNATISNATRLVKVASGWATGTLTLPAISAVSTDSCIRIEDGGSFIDATHTLTIAANAADKINGGGAGGSTATYTTANMGITFCVSAANNWNIHSSTIVPAVAAVSHQFLTSLSTAGAWGQSQPAFTDISGTATVAQGGTGLTSGTSGGVLAYTASGTLASSGALTANLPVIGGGAGVAPTVGTRSGNTTAYVTTTGTQTSGDCVKIDANGNHIANGSACGGGGVTCPSTGSTVYTAVLGDCVNTQNASASANLTWEIPTGYSHARLTCDDILNSANVVDYIQFDVGGGLLGGTAYTWGGVYVLMNGGSATGEQAAGVKGIRVAYNDNTGTTSFVANLQGLAGGSQHTVSSQEIRKGSATSTQGSEAYGGFFSTNTTAVVKFALIPDSGTLTTAKCTARLDPI